MLSKELIIAQPRPARDPFAELRKMSDEDRKDRSKIQARIDAYFAELDSKK